MTQAPKKRSGSKPTGGNRGSALRDLKAFAKKMSLEVITDVSEIAEELEYAPEGVEAVAGLYDHGGFFIDALVVNGQLMRPGDDEADEDPADVFPTTVEELVARHQSKQDADAEEYRTYLDKNPEAKAAAGWMDFILSPGGPSKRGSELEVGDTYAGAKSWRTIASLQRRGNNIDVVHDDGSTNMLNPDSTFKVKA